MKMKCLYVVPSLLLAALLIACKGNATAIANTQLETYRDSQPMDQQCPTWFVQSSNGTQCKCGQTSMKLKCDQNSQQVWLYVTSCMTYDNATKNTLVGDCPVSALQSSQSYYVLLPKDPSKLNEFMCGNMNRVGQMCHKCRPGFGPAVLSYEGKCVKCSNTYGWLLYLLRACIPTTILFFVTIVFQLRVITCLLCSIVLLWYSNTPTDSCWSYWNTIPIFTCLFSICWILEFRFLPFHYSSILHK